MTEWLNWQMAVTRHQVLTVFAVGFLFGAVCGVLFRGKPA